MEKFTRRSLESSVKIRTFTENESMLFLSHWNEDQLKEYHQDIDARMKAITKKSLKSGVPEVDEPKLYFYALSTEAGLKYYRLLVSIYTTFTTGRGFNQFTPYVVANHESVEEEVDVDTYLDYMLHQRQLKNETA